MHYLWMIFILKVVFIVLVRVNAGPVVIRGFKDVNIIEGMEFQGADMTTMNADNSQQCLRLCWLYSNCSIVTFYPNKLRCRLINQLPDDLNALLVTEHGAVTVDMRLATIDKPRLHGCDHRNCELDELCVPVVDPDSYKCLLLGFKKCPSQLPSVANSVVTMDGLSTMAYSCQDGYVISGSNHVTSCDQASGRWSLIDVSCTFTDCGTPPRLDGANSIGNDTFYNARVVYSCFDGHVSNSSSLSITCQANSQWTTPPDPCVLVTCPEPTTVMNGAVRVLERLVVNRPVGQSADIDMDMAYAGTAVHFCQEGYQSQTTPEFRSECQQDGTWESPSSFRCDPVDCGRPPAIANTWNTFNATTFQARAGYVCVEGFESLNGIPKRELICNATGSWSGPEVTCQIVDCGTPPNEENATAVYSTTSYLSEANYTCNEPSYMYPDNVLSRSCRANGQWSNESVVCISCGEPAKFPYAFYNISILTKDYYVADYYCEEGYVLDGESRDYEGVVCLPSHSDWQKMPHVVCQKISCGEAPKVSNATVTSNGTVFQSVASYSCNEGYIMSQRNATTLVCGLEGWSGDLGRIECLRISCGLPPMMNNSFYVTDSENGANTTFNSTVEYDCMDGFVLTSVSNTKRCLSDGTWDNSSISCKKIGCSGEPHAVPNASWKVEETDSRYIRAVYECVEGYRLAPGSDENFVTCVDGIWTHSGKDNNVTCLPVDCGKPPSVNGSTRTFSGTLYKDKADYTCENGKSITGVCQSDGVWSLGDNANSTSSLCTDKQVCKTPPAFPNATLLNSTVKGLIDKMAEYLTSALASATPTTPMPPGDLGRVPSEWESGNTAESTSSSPRGITSNEKHVTGTQSVTKSPASEDLNQLDIPGNIAMYKCDEGYQTIDNGYYFVYTCEDDGVWRMANISDIQGEYESSKWGSEDVPGGGSNPCVAVKCGQPPAVEDASVEFDSSTYGSKAEYVCDTGMKLKDAAVTTRTCLANGKWSDVSIACQIDGCGPPPVYSNTTIVHLSGTTDMGTAIYQCDTGFQFSDPSLLPRLVCNKNRWIGLLSESSCSIVDCHSPPKISNATVIAKTTTYGSVATYQCESAFLPVGYDTKTCGPGGSWLGDDYFYCFKKCDKPAYLRHGVFELQGDLGQDTVASYSCDRGYELKRNISKMTCLKNHTWSNDDIDCLKLECGPVPIVSNAGYLLTMVVDGVLNVSYSCSDGYIHNGGDLNLYCYGGKRNKDWQGVEIVCDVDPCTEAPNVEHATAHVTLNEFGSDAVYTCDKGFEHWWFDSKSCTSHSGWSEERVQCNMTDCGSPPDYPNSEKSFDNTSYLSEVAFMCDEGYRPLTKISKKTCTESGEWSTGFIECSKKFLVCRVPPEEPYSTLSHGSLVTAEPMATYVCQTGYTKHVTTYHKFCRFYHWRGNSEFHRCELTTCPTPLEVPNANISSNSSNTYQSQVNYTCNDGYQMAGLGSKVCQLDGTWSNDGIECFNNTVSFCPEPPKVDDATVTVYSYMGKAVYTCLPGYTGGGIMHCKRGKWVSSQNIECTALDCGTPIEFQDATLTVKETTYGKWAVYDCNSKIPRPVRSFCNASGIWSLERDPCKRPYQGYNPSSSPCQLPIPWTANAMTKIMNNTGVLTVVNTCKMGYSALTSSDTFITFCQDGKWMQREFSQCLPVGPCLNVPYVENADSTGLAKAVRNESELIFKVTYKCHKGYDIQGRNLGNNLTDEGSVVCYPSTGWEELPVCNIVDCGPFPVSNETINPHAATMANKTTYLSNITVACQPPFIGPNVTTMCQANGSWSNVTMACRDSYCDAPPSIHGGTLFPSDRGQNETSQITESSWEVQCHRDHQYLGTGETVTCRLNLETFEEEWRGLNKSFCAQSTWWEPAMPFTERIHLEKGNYFNKITVCFEGAHSGARGEYPFNTFLTFHDVPWEDLSKNSPFQARLRLNGNLNTAVLDHKLNAKEEVVVVGDRPYRFQDDKAIAVCALMYVHNSTFIATVDSEIIGEFVYSTVPAATSESLSWAQFVSINQNIVLDSVKIQYQMFSQVLEPTTPENILGNNGFAPDSRF